MNRSINIDCDDALAAIDARYDGEATRLGDDDLDRHLHTCSECSDYAAHLVTVRRELQATRMIPMSQEAIDTVLALTVDQTVAPHVAQARGLRRLATAAVVALAVLGPWMVLRQSNDSAAVEDVERASMEVRYVMQLTFGALQRVEDVATEEIMESHVSSALTRVVDTWTEFTNPFVRKPGL